jgi:hypothetical protein
VQLDNGSSITLNPENRLKTLRPGALADKDLFKMQLLVVFVSDGIVK